VALSASSGLVFTTSESVWCVLSCDWVMSRTGAEDAMSTFMYVSYVTRTKMCWHAKRCQSRDEHTQTENESCHMTHSRVWHDLISVCLCQKMLETRRAHTDREWVLSHIRMSHVIYTNESCHSYEWVMSRTRMSHVTCMNESCHTYEQVMSHLRLSHVTHMNESCHI